MILLVLILLNFLSLPKINGQIENLRTSGVNATERLLPSNIDGQAIQLSNGNFLFILTNVNTSSTSAAAATPTPPDELYPHRIVNGQPIQIIQSPWTVAIIRNGQLWCGGSVLSRRWVLTAAHCVTDGGRLVVRAGSKWFRSHGQLRRAVKLVVHSNYNPNTMQNDIALIKLNAPLRYSRYVRRVILPSANHKLPNWYFVSGWGLRHESHFNPARQLRRTHIFPIRHSSCVSSYSGQIRITRNMICAGAEYRDSCSGDSGGPLIWRRRQFGIVSFGIGCARLRYPGVYTDVRKYRLFIDFVMRNN